MHIYVEILVYIRSIVEQAPRYTSAPAFCLHKYQSIV